MKSKNTLFIFIFLTLTSCKKTTDYAEMLKGNWIQTNTIGQDLVKMILFSSIDENIGWFSESSYSNGPGLEESYFTESADRLYTIDDKSKQILFYEGFTNKPNLDIIAKITLINNTNLEISYRIINPTTNQPPIYSTSYTKL